MRFRLLSSLIVAALIGAPALARAQAVDRTLNAASSASPCPAESCAEVPGFPNGVAVQLYVPDTASPGTWTAQFEGTLNGATWVSVSLTPPGSTTSVTSATAPGVWRGAAGMRFRVRLSAYTSGQPKVAIVPLDTPPVAGGGSAGGTDGVAQGSTTSGQSGVLGQGAVTTAAPLYTTGQTSPFSLDVNGALRVAITSGAGSGGTSIADRSGTFTPNTTSFTLSGGFMDEVAPDACTEGAPCAFRLTSARQLRVDGTGGTFPTSGTAATDAAVSGNPVYTAGRASAAVPTDVSADGDVVPPWLLRSGAQVVQPSYAGVLSVAGNGASGTGVQRVTLANDSTGVLASIGSITGAITLPTGASTAANQATEITALQLIDDPVVTLGTTTYTEASSKAFTINAVRRDADTTLVDTTNEMAPLQVNAGGQLKVACIAGCSGSTFADNAAFTFGTTVISPIGGVFDDTSSNTATENSAAIARITANKAIHVNLRSAAGVELTPSTDQTLDAALTTTGPLMVGRGSTATPTAMSADNDATALWLDLNGRLHLAAEGVEDVAHVGAEFGMRMFARRLDTPLTSSGTSGDWSTLDSSPEGALYTTPIATAGISAGALTYGVQAAASTNAANVKASAGNVYGIHAINTTATVYYLRLYNLAASPTCSSATGFVETIPIPANTSGAGVVLTFPVGKAFATGIGHCITGGGTSTDNTNAATGVYVGLEYK